MLYAEYCFEEEIDITNTSTKGKNEETFVKIAKILNALMNGIGGLIVLDCGMSASPEHMDEWKETFQSFVTTQWISDYMYGQLVTSKAKVINRQFYLYIFVEKSCNRVIFNFNAYIMRNGKSGMILENEVTRLRQRTVDVKPEKPGSRLEDLIKRKVSFTLGTELPPEYCESKTMKFKHYKSINRFIAKNIMEKLNADDMLREDISAFANTDGGSLVVGVEDNKAAVRGFPVAHNQQDEEQKLTGYIKGALDGCIWNGKQVGSDKYWNVFYHDVKSDKQTDHKIIEISVRPCEGGMFLKKPVYYTVDKDTMDQSSRLKEEFIQLEERQKVYLEDDIEDNDDSLGKHAAETEQVKHYRRRETSPEKIETDKLVKEGNPTDISLNAKTYKSFTESQSKYKPDIDVRNLSVHARCVKDMTAHIQSLTEHAHDDEVKLDWYPPANTLTRTCVPNSEKTFEYINKQKWEGIASVIEIQPKLETGITKSLLDVLVISNHGSPKVVCCFENDGDLKASEKEYALNLGRELKYRFLMSPFNTEHLPLHFHLDIHVLTLSQNGPVSMSWNSAVLQPVEYPSSEKSDQSQYDVACTGLAEWFLHSENSLKNCRGEVLMEHLTAEQAKIILERKEKILIVPGVSGTGKTAVALTLILETSKKPKIQGKSHNILYICASSGVQAYVENVQNESQKESQQLCRVTVWNMNRRSSLSDNEKSDLKNFDLVLVDDAHTIPHREEDPNDLYKLLFTLSANTKTEVVILFDQFQDFKFQIPNEFDEKLREVAIKAGLRKDEIQIIPLDKRIRNSGKINSFIQANQNQAGEPGRAQCLTERDGDDVTYSYIGSSSVDLASSVNAILDRLTQQYDPAKITVLCDDEEHLQIIPYELMTKFNRSIQNAESFPIRNTVMCKLEEYGGLEADVILFLLPPNWGLEKYEYVGNSRYVYCVSSRAIQRLEFLVPWYPSGNQQREKKLEQLLNLFEAVSTNTTYKATATILNIHVRNRRF